MSRETTRATAEKLVAHCRADTTIEGLDTLYDPSAISVEAVPSPGTTSAETRGVPAIKDKHAWWGKTMAVHESSVEGPYPHGDDRFALIFAFDATNRETGDRFRMQEIGLYTCDAAGRIVREEFFYAG